jgi:DNA (cytosine-5)-methyltransferase 1
MTQYEAWPDEPIDLLVGGTPCQSFSVAGLRKGLADPRGNLMLTYGAIAKRYSPKWLVWENVPGVLSSNRGRDFGTFLGMLAELGYGFAYRVLDAQYFGVAQRRRRVFVVGYLGDWHRAAAVLFERHSLCGHPAPSREKGQGTTANVEGSVELCGPLNARDYKDPGTDGMNRNSAKMVPVAQPIPYDFFQITAPVNRQAREPGDPCHTLARDNAAHATIVQPMQVRRLTPVECERLQGFPDGYTNIPWRNKPESPDGPRYKAMGNSMAVPVMHWFGKRIAAVDAL